MPRIVFYPYNMGSRSVRALQDNIQGHRAIRVRENGRYQPRPDDVIIGWGNPRIPNWTTQGMLNIPESVVVSSDKLATAQIFEDRGVPQPAFTTRREEALRWLRDGNAVMARQLLRASGGRGLVYVERQEDLPDAPLYTSYVKKMDEFRVHVFNGQVIDYQQKRRRNGHENPNNKIRNHDNGWVFCRTDVVLPNGGADRSIRAVAALGLDFGAVDLIYNRYQNQTYVLEVNTAPGLEGTTLERYTRAITGLIA